MDSQPLFCRRAALCGRDDHSGHHVQAPRTIEHGHRALYQLALPALGDQAFLEPICRSAQDEALVDRHDAVADRRGLRRHSVLHPNGVLFATVLSVLLAVGFRIGNPRHRRRWILYVSLRQRRAVLLCGDTQHVLPPGHHLRARHFGHAGGCIRDRHVAP